MNKKEILKIIKYMKKKKIVKSIDFYCCTLLIFNNIPEIILVILYLSYATHLGHSCLPITMFKKNLFNKKKKCIKKLLKYIIKNKDWYNNIINSNFCSNGSIIKPLIIQKNNFYLYRYWVAENRIIKFIQESNINTQYDLNQYKILINKYCKKKINKLQEIALGIMLLNDISFILGSPGTGKTNIITYFILILIKLNKKKINILLAAPTGKAANKLTETVYQKISMISLNQEEKKQLPKKGITLHNLFNIQKENNEIYKNKKNKKKISNIDILIIDEASMIDLYMMENITIMVKKKTKIIFLGDINQLQPIEMGSILKEVCKNSNNQYSIQFSKILSKITNKKININILKKEYCLNDKIIILKKIYRFKKKSGIGIISKKLEKKRVNIFNIVKKKYSNVIWKKLDTQKNYLSMLKEIKKTYKLYSIYIKKNHNPINIFKKFNKFRILCALIDGPFGTKIINELIDNEIKKYQLISNNHFYINEWYYGKPIIITKNCPKLELLNGDIGICLLNEFNKFKIFFLSYKKNFKSIDPNIIQNYETAWSTTIHKSQGSEFSYVKIIIPNYKSKILSKELIYTAITRAKKEVTIYSNIKIINDFINLKNIKYSGIYLNLHKNFL